MLQKLLTLPPGWHLYLLVAPAGDRLAEHLDLPEPPLWARDRRQEGLPRPLALEVLLPPQVAPVQRPWQLEHRPLQPEH